MTLDASQPVLVLAPRGRDGELIHRLLADHGIAAHICTTASDMLAGMQTDAGCAIIAQEAFEPAFYDQLSTSLARQPPWSDFPLLVLMTSATSDTLAKLTKGLGNVTILERPIAPQTLLAATRAAIRGRVRQFDARAAIQQRDQFLAMLGHELRNPLAAIVLAAKLARDATERARIDDRLELIDRQSRLLARLVDDLLDVARVTSGKVRLRREAVDIDQVVRTCIEALEERAEQRGISVTYAGASGAVIEGDTVRLEQVISNLVSNAIKYSPTGRTVRVTSAIAGDACELRVRDQGIGIAPEMQAHVFDLFAQAEAALDRADGGMGIGLTLVERLVRLHGGSIELFSAGLGMGTEFVVRLPIGDPPVANNVVRIDNRPEQQPLRIVLVEDNPDLRTMTQELLEALDCVVEVAVDGPEGVATICRARPDLALVDIGLPGLDGFAVARKVRADCGAGLLLIAVTGYGADHDREEAQRAGFNLHATKPLSIDTLRGLLEQAREHRRQAAGKRSTG